MFIQCSECGKRMSDRAPRCPFCGAAAPGASDEHRPLERKTSDLAGNTVTKICDHAKVSEEAVESLATEGVKLDHSLASLAAVDQYLDDAFGGGRAPGADSWTPTPDDRKLIAMLGSYLGEVLRRRLGGDWEDDAERPGMPLYVRLRLPSGSAILPLERTYRRLKEGRANALEGFAADLRRQLGDREVRPEDGMDWANQATDYIRNERFDVALQFLRRAVEIDDQLCEGWFCRGFVEEKLARPHDALRSYDRALQLSPADDRAFLQHVKAQIQRLNADLGGYRHVTGELRPLDSSPGAQPPRPAATSDDDVSLEDLRDVVSDDGPAESSVVRAINETRAADADTAVPGATGHDEIRDAASAVQRADDRHEADTLQPVESKLALASTMQGTADEPATAATPPASGLRLDDLPDVASPDLFGPPVDRATLPQSALKVEDIQGRLRENILEKRAAPSTDAAANVDEALSLAGAGRIEAAAELADDAFAATGDAGQLLAISRILCAGGRPQRAIAAVRKALELDSGDPEAHRLHTSVLLAEDLPDEAVGAATAALARWPDASWAWYLHGRAHFAADKFDDAVRSFERALGLDPAHAEAWRLRGIAEFECGRIEEARAALKAYLQLADIADAPATREARRQLAKLELAR